MKKWLPSVFYVLMAVFLVAAVGACKQNNGNSAVSSADFGGAPAAQGKYDQEPHKAGGMPVRVGVGLNNPPMEFRNHRTREWDGMEIELSREVFKRAGIKHEYRAIEWGNRNKELLQDKTIDILWMSVSVTDERRKNYAFSVPYFKNQQVVAVAADSSIHAVSDLGGSVVGIRDGAIAAEYAQKINGKVGPVVKVVRYPDEVTVMVALLQGEVDAVVGDSAPIRYNAKQTPGKYRILDEVLGEEDLAVAFRPDDTVLLEKVNKALSSMQADGTLQKIQEKWLGTRN